ncbi:MAG: hypothetical protein IJW46_04710 [Clostridia bacterium]|nr:hypothetical protein [Clostridia bacterium]
MKQEKALSTRVLTAVGKVAVFAALFPYQVTLNRKEGSFSVRSVLLGFRVQRKVDGEGNRSADATFSCPGFAFREAKKSILKHMPQKEEKKKKFLKRKNKAKKEATDESEEA